MLSQRHGIKYRILSIDRKALGIVLFIILAFFVSKWTIQGAWFVNDLVTTTVPLENLYASIQRSGQSPLWAPELAGGYPLLATGQLGFWYPPHMLLRHFLPGVWTLNISLLLHALLAAAGSYVFLRVNKIGRMAASLGALLVPLGGAFTGKYEMVNLVLPFMWVPILLLFLQLFLERGKIHFLFYWVAFNSLCILAGHPQMAILILLLEAIFVISVLLVDWRRWARSLAVLASVFLVIGLTSAYLLPIFDNLSATDRAYGIADDKENSFEFSFSMEAFKGVALVHPFGHAEQYQGPKNEAELSSYIGLLGLVFGIIGLLLGRRRFLVLWTFSIIILVMGISLAMGGQSPAYRFLVDLGWKYFSSPARFFLLANFGLVFLAAMGFHVVIARVSRKSLSYIVAIVLITATILPVLWVGWFWYEGFPWKLIRQPELASIVKSQEEFIRIFSRDRISDMAPHDDFDILVWDQVRSHNNYRQTFISPYDAIEGIKIKLSRGEVKDGVVLLSLFSAEGKRLRESRIDFKDIMDSDWTLFAFDPLLSVGEEPLYFELTSSIAQQGAPTLFVHANSDDEQYDPTGILFTCRKNNCSEVKVSAATSSDMAFRIAIPRAKNIKELEILAPFISAGHGINAVQWTGPLAIRNVVDYLEPFGERGGNSVWQDYSFLVNRFPITHIIGLFSPHRHGSNLINFTEVASVPYNDMFIRLYKNNDAFPRLHLVENIIAVSGSEEQRNALSTIDPKDKSTVVADISQDAKLRLGGTAHIIREERSRIVIKTTNSSEGFLVMRDVFLSGWMATIDNNSTPIYLTDSLFRGVFVPAGDHEVVFTYKPRWVNIAVVISLSAFSIFVLLGYLSFKFA